MRYNRLGQSDLQVSVLGLGAFELGGTQYGPINEGEGIDAIVRGLELGVNFIDTAPLYGLGHSEEVLARILKGRRSQVIIATKFGLVWDDVGNVRLDLSRESIMTELESSLRRLQTDYIDLYQVHWPDGDNLPSEEMARALEDIQLSGKARYIGVANFMPEQLKAMRGFLSIISEQVGYNLLDRRPELDQDVFSTCMDLQIGVICYGTLSYGILSGTFTPETAFNTNDWRSGGSAFGLPLFQRDTFLHNLLVVEEIKVFAAELRMTAPQLAIAWALRKLPVNVALTGCRKPSEIEENVGGAEKILNNDEAAEVDRIMLNARGTRGKLHHS